MKAIKTTTAMTELNTQVDEREQALVSLRTAQEVGYIDTGKVDDEERQIVLVPKYETNWDYAECSDPIRGYFDDIDEALEDVEEPGDLDLTDEYYEPSKRLIISFDKGYIDEEGDVNITDENISYDEIDSDLIPDFIKSLVDDLNGLIAYNYFTAPSAKAAELLEEVSDNINDDIIDEYEGFKIESPFTGKYRDINISDSNDNAVHIKLRIADHPYNPANNDADEHLGMFISVEIYEGKSNVRFDNKYSLHFDSDSTYDEIVDAVNNRIIEIIDIHSDEWVGDTV